MNKILTVKLRGGLGNQLFQYAYARSIQESQPNIDLFLDDSYFNIKHIRGLELDKLNLPKEIKWNHKGNRLFSYLYDLYRVVDRLSKHKLKPFTKVRLINNLYCFCDKQPEFGKDFFNCANKVYLAGYFQVEKDVRNVKEHMRSVVRFTEKMSDNAKNYLLGIKERECIGISVRAGKDYVKFGWPMCSKEYYIKGVDLVKKKHPNCNVFVFADDVHRIKSEKWFDGIDVTFVEECSATESLFLLSECSHFIIANSTFSWWGAYLSANENKIVVAPHWFYSNMTMQDSGLDIPGSVYLNNNGEFVD